jgi:multiple sugar transport system permease protein
VALPLARAPLAAIVIFNFLWSWNSLLWPLMVTGSTELRPVQLGLSYFVAQRQFIEGIASSGLKG